MNNNGAMKVGAIVKIVIWGVVLIILCSVLISGLALGSFENIGGFTVWNWEVYDDPDSYTVGNCEYSDVVRDVDIDWHFGGNVTVTVYDGDTVKVEETAHGEIEADDEMRVKLEDGRLTVKFRRSGMRFWDVAPKKDLNVYLPVECAGNIGEISIDSSSSTVKITGITASNAEIDTASGKLYMTDCTVETVEIDSASGDAELSGKYGFVEIDTASGDCVIKGQVRSVDFDGASGSCTMELTQLPEQLTADCASGSVRLNAPVGDGFKADIDAASGKGYVEYADGNKMSGDELVVGGGKYRYEMDFASGSFYFKEVG